MTYDPEADALLVELLPGARSAKTTRPGILERLTSTRRTAWWRSRC